MVLDEIVVKLFKSFMTSLILFYSRKLVYMVDNFFSDVMSTEDVIECPSCGIYLKTSILLRFDRDHICPQCQHELIY